MVIGRAERPCGRHSLTFSSSYLALFRRNRSVSKRGVAPTALREDFFGFCTPASRPGLTTGAPTGAGSRESRTPTMNTFVASMRFLETGAFGSRKLLTPACDNILYD